MKKLEFSDFTLETGGSGYFYFYLGLDKSNCQSVNWPFHPTIEEKDMFLEKILTQPYSKYESFPEVETEAQATMILLLAILDYNERHEKTTT